MITNCEKFERQKETIVAYFMSEFALARATRNSISSRQLDALLSYKKNK